MLKRLMIAAAIGAGGLMLGSCATMSEGQCLAGDWSGQGYADGAAGHGQSRLAEHAEACAEHGVTPDADAYFTGHEQGVRVYCQPGNAFTLGRNGSGYGRGFCPAGLEEDFLYALADGRLVHDAIQRMAEVESRAREARQQADRVETQIRIEEDRLDDDGVTDEMRQTIRQRIRRLRDDRDRDLADARELDRDVQDARREISRLENRFLPLYGDW